MPNAPRGSPAGTGPVRVLVIDNSLTMRRLIRLALSTDPRVEVVGEARDARQARDQITRLLPDVLTLDVEMPGQSGLAFLRHLMAVRPMPVIMVSTETRTGSAAAIEALSLGAVDCVGKPVSGTSAADFAMLSDVIVAAATARIRPRNLQAVPPGPLPDPAKTAGFIWNGRIVLIGSSTGGVDALERILGAYPADGPPTVIAQHMPAGFLANLTRRLDERLAPTVRQAATGDPLLPGHVYIAPGGECHLTVTTGRTPACRLVAGDKRGGHRPSVDVLFESAVGLGARAVAVLLTGMGRDGADGMLRMRQAGSTCLAQDRDSSVVWGMPRVAYEIGAAERLVALPVMAAEILRASGRPVRRAAGNDRT